MTGKPKTALVRYSEKMSHYFAEISHCGLRWCHKHVVVKKDAKYEINRIFTHRKKHTK